MQIIESKKVLFKVRMDLWPETDYMQGFRCMLHL